MIGLLPVAALAVVVAILLRLSGARGIFMALACGALIAGGLLFNALRDDVAMPADKPEMAKNQLSSLAADRYALMGRFTRSERWLTMADSIASRGNSVDAANLLVAAVKQHPRDYSLWIGLGNMLTDHGGGLNPAARLAFERAIDIAPAYPAPRYFLGLAEARSGNFGEARRLWAAVLADAPANASWRPLVEDRLAAHTTPIASVHR